MKKPIAALAAIPFFATAGPPARADGLSANVSLTTKYKYRGQDQSDPDKDSVPAIRGGFDYKVGATCDFGNGLSRAGAIVGADKKEPMATSTRPA